MDSSIGDKSVLEVLSDAELDGLIDTAVDVVLKLDEDGLIDSFVETTPTLGYRREHILGDPVTVLRAQGDADDTTPGAFRETLLEEKVTATTQFEAADGTVVPVSVTVLDRSDGDGTVCFVSEHQPTRDTQAQILEDIADPVFVLDSTNRFERVNDAFLGYTGYKRSELLGRRIGDVISGQSYNRAMRELTANQNTTATRFEVDLTTASGDVLLTEAHVRGFTDSSNYDGSIGVLRDIQERTKRERDLELLKQVLTRIFRHNIRNELMVIQGHAERLDEGVRPELRTHATEILETVDRLQSHSENARSIEQVLNTDGLYEVDLAATVEQITAEIRDVYPAAHIDLDLPEDASVHAHPDIEKAITELVQNAIEHAPADEQAQVELWIDQQEGAQTLFVEDESGGLASNEQHVLQKGIEHELEHSSGVGLWLIRWLVDYSNAELITHQTATGTLMGIRFGQSTGSDRTVTDSETVTTTAPAHVRTVPANQLRERTVIGRVEALDTLTDTYDSLTETGGHGVLITGEAGVGKTTLVEQFRDQITQQDPPPVVATGHCEKDDQPPYQAFRQILADIPSERDLSELLAEVSSLSATDTSERREHKRLFFAAVAEQLRAVGSDQPVVLLLEDMQWADQGTIDLFEYLLDEVGRWGHPVLFVGTCRTSDVDRSDTVDAIAAELAETGRGTVLDLEPFDTAAVRSLLSAMLGVEEFPPSFIEAVHDHTGGSPLFVSELGAHLARTLESPQDAADLPDDLSDIPVPETVESAVGDRLARLDQQTLSVLHTGAVIGTEFSFDVLRAASDRTVETLVDCIDMLVERHVWTRTDGTIEFVHGVVREQALATVDDDRRESLHTRAAHAIESVYGDSVTQYAGRLAHHYEQTGADETAFEYYREAGEQAAETYAYDDAIEYYERALTLGTEHEIADTTAVGEIHATLGTVYRATGRIEASLETLREGLDVAPDEAAVTCELLGELTRSQLVQSKFEAATESAQQQRRLAASLAARRLEADALTNLGEIARRQGDYEQARASFKQSLEIRREIGDRQGEALNLHTLGVLDRHQGNHDRASEYYERSLGIRERIGDRKGKAKTLTSLGILRTVQGDYEGARECCERSLELFREIGSGHRRAQNLMILGSVAESQGEYAAAREYHERSLELNRETGNRRNEASDLHNLGSLAARKGDYDRANHYLQQSLDIKREIGNSEGESKTLNDLARVATERGAYDSAHEYATRGLELSQGIGDSEGEVWNRQAVGTILRLRGEYDRAQEQLRNALEQAREIGLRRPEIIILRELGVLARQQSAHDRATQYLQDSLDRCDGDENPYQRAQTRLEQARLALAAGAVDTARERVQQAHRTFAELGATHYEGRAAALRGDIAAAANEPRQARAHWLAALDLFEQVGAPQDRLDTLETLVAHYEEHGHEEQVDGCVTEARQVLADAPDPVATTHREWVERESGSEAH